MRPTAGSCDSPGHDPVSPINTSAVLTTGFNVTLTPASPSVTTTVDGAMILRLAGFDDDDITVDSPGLSGHTAITMDKSGNGNGTASGGGGYTTLPSFGSSGQSTFSLYGKEETVAITVAIAPE